MLRNQTFAAKDIILIDPSFFYKDGEPKFSLFRAISYRKQIRLHEVFDFALLYHAPLNSDEALVLSQISEFSAPLLGTEEITSASHYNFMRNACFGVFCPLLDKRYGRSSKSFMSEDADVFLACLLREIELPINMLTWANINRE